MQPTTAVIDRLCLEEKSYLESDSRPEALEGWMDCLTANAHRIPCPTLVSSPVPGESSTALDARNREIRLSASSKQVSNRVLPIRITGNPVQFWNGPAAVIVEALFFTITPAIEFSVAISKG